MQAGQHIQGAAPAAAPALPAAEAGLRASAGAERRAHDRTRLEWVDAAKGIGILLMFYGHFLQRGVPAGNASAADQLRLIYSFHMPLFFVLAGCFYRPGRPFWATVERLAWRRLLPVAFFTVLLAPTWLSWELHHSEHLWRDSLGVGGEYLSGRPDLNWVTWFLVCLFSCEVLALPALRWCASAGARVLLAGACLALGVVFGDHSVHESDGPAYFVGRAWFFSEAIVALGFYALGSALLPGLRALAAQRGRAALALALGAVAVLATYGLNRDAHGPVVVMMAARQHGNLLAFAGTALAGTLAVIGLGALLDRSAWLQWVGRTSVPFLGLNGLFFHAVNPWIARHWHLADSGAAVLQAGLLVTAASLLACVPVVYALDRYLPQLIGRSAVDGPWLPSLERRRGGPRRRRPWLRGGLA